MRVARGGLALCACGLLNHAEAVCPFDMDRPRVVALPSLTITMLCPGGTCFIAMNAPIGSCPAVCAGGANSAFSACAGCEYMRMPAPSSSAKPSVRETRIFAAPPLAESTTDPPGGMYAPVSAVNLEDEQPATSATEASRASRRPFFIRGLQVPSRQMRRAGLSASSRRPVVMPHRAPRGSRQANHCLRITCLLAGPSLADSHDGRLAACGMRLAALRNDDRFGQWGDRSHPPGRRDGSAELVLGVAGHRRTGPVERCQWDVPYHTPADQQTRGGPEQPSGG